MEHSEHYEQVKRYYDTIIAGKRLWSIERVRKAVSREWITTDEFKEITGEAYK